MHRSEWIRGSIIAAGALSLLLIGGSAQAATRSMVGSLGVINPSVADPFFFTTGPEVLGKKAGPFAPDRGATTVSVTGAAATTSVGRQVTVAQNKLGFSGTQIRDFAAFPTVANLNKQNKKKNKAKSPNKFLIVFSFFSGCRCS